VSGLAAAWHVGAVRDNLINCLVRVGAPSAWRKVDEHSAVPVVGDNERAIEEVVEAKSAPSSLKSTDTLA